MTTDFDEKLIARSEALIAQFKKAQKRIAFDSTWRKLYSDAIAEEQRYVDHLKSQRKVYTVAQRD